MQDENSAGPRKRDASATRSAILASARQVFAASGYDGAGVREIAAKAGVTAMLVNRYFGSKEELFREAITAANSSPTIATRAVMTAPNAGETIARALVGITKRGETPLEGFSILLNSASSPRAAEIGRVAIEAGHQKTITGVLDGEHAAERAALIQCIVAGVQMLRQSVGLRALAEADPDVLVELLTPLFDKLVQPKATASS
jgi:AcrR family transcriptional regulator